jgi:hypothetical protein
LTCFSFAQAQERARDFFAKKARQLAGHSEPQAGPYTVKMAIEDYLRERAKTKGLRADRYASEARILPELGEVEIAKLTFGRIRDWHQAVAAAPKLVRAKKLAAKRATKSFNADDPEQVRARRSTANRLLTILKAALNHAFNENRAYADEPWRRVKPFREVDAAKVQHLQADERTRLVKHL